MKVSFTQKEYSRLMELVHLGMRAVMSRQGGESPHFERYTAIEQKILGLAEVFGCSDMVNVGRDGKLIQASKIDEDERLRKIVGESDNGIFWDELVARLADRDLGVEQTMSSLAMQDGPPINADARLKEIEDAYWEEFEKYDLARVLVMRASRG
ncbi:MAG: hypothetical protein J6386_02395 [Candidatus Synoicihabitans palmerolidicus]|nr:hypothetical protein [Candidatus Synoicihabitans palmerolidicus]